MDGKTLATPDFSPAAIVSLILLVLTNGIVLLGLELSEARKAAIAGLVNGIVLGAYLIHDAVIRNGRARAFTNAPKPLEDRSGA